MFTWLKNLFMKKPKRIELVYVSWSTAEKLLTHKNEKWQIAPEEDNNMLMGTVWLERVSNE